MLDIAAILRDLGQDGYVVPRPHPSLVTRRLLVMERLSGFKFDDVDGMRAAGIDTQSVIRTGMIAFMEGALLHGVFHGDLHGGNLFVLPDGRTALLDFGIVGRLTGARRLAFLRLMLGATTNDVKGQMAALRDLGALPMDTDLDAEAARQRPVAAGAGDAAPCGVPHDAALGRWRRNSCGSGVGGRAAVAGKHASSAARSRQRRGCRPQVSRDGGRLHRLRHDTRLNS